MNASKQLRVMGPLGVFMTRDMRDRMMRSGGYPDALGFHEAVIASFKVHLLLVGDNADLGEEFWTAAFLEKDGQPEMGWPFFILRGKELMEAVPDKHIEEALTKFSQDLYENDLLWVRAWLRRTQKSPDDIPELGGVLAELEGGTSAELMLGSLPRPSHLRFWR